MKLSLARSPSLAAGVLILLACAVAPLAHAAPPAFQGRIDLRLQDAEPQGANYALSGDRARIDVPSVAHAHDVHAVVDFARRMLVTMDESRRQTASLPLPELGANAAAVQVRRTGKWRMVVGQPCERWDLTDAGHVVEACVVAGVPWFDPRRLEGQDVPAWSRRLEAERAFPVSVWEGDGRSARTVFASWATDVRREVVPDSELAVPRTAKKP